MENVSVRYSSIEVVSNNGNSAQNVSLIAERVGSINVINSSFTANLQADNYYGLAK